MYSSGRWSFDWIRCAIIFVAYNIDMEQLSNQNTIEKKKWETPKAGDLK